MDAYHETSLTNKNGAHHPRGQEPKQDQVQDQETVFTDPSTCPRYKTTITGVTCTSEFVLISECMNLSPFLFSFYKLIADESERMNQSVQQRINTDLFNKIFLRTVYNFF